MRNLLIVTSLLFLGICIFSCNKQEIPSTNSETPIFSVNAIIDGNPINFIAGQNNIYLYTKADIIADSVNSNTGHFAQANCQNCPNSLEFIIKSPLGDPNPLTSAQKLGYSAPSLGATFIDTIFKTSLTPSPFDDQFTYTWNINLPNNSYLGPMIALDLINDQLYTVQMTAMNANSNTTFFSEVDIDLNSQTPCVLGNLTIGPDPSSFDSTIILGLDLSGTLSPITATWSTGETTESIIVNQPGNYCLTLTDDTGCEQRICANFTSIQNQGSLTIPTINYQIETFLDTNFNFVPYGVQIRYIDENGQEWDTEYGVQSENASFNILNTDSFEDNEYAEPTQQIEIDFDCMLFNGFGAIKPLAGSGKIAVGK